MIRSTLLRITLASLLAAVPCRTDAATKKPSSSTSKTTAKTPAKKPAPEPYDWAKPPSIQSGSCILVDGKTGSVLHEISADTVRPVASTQKLLTALIVAEGGDLRDKVRIESSDTQCEPTKLYMKPGETYARGDLLKILLVKSMNDVARALARDSAGSIDQFADKMNAKARALGMTRSRFANPNGLPDPAQYSTARDMSRLALFAYRNRTIRECVSAKSMKWTYASGRTVTFENTNRVLKGFPLCNGMKTGYTDAAGRCLISSASDGNRHVIAVILGDRSSAIWSDSYRMLVWGLKELGADFSSVAAR